MGTQGEIYNILGVEIDAECIRDGNPVNLKVFNAGEDNGNKVHYVVNGHTVASYDYEGEKCEFEEGIMSGGKLSIRMLGHDERMGSRHFKGKALVGRIVANESYINSATKFPPEKTIENMRSEIVEQVKENLGLEIKKEDLEIYLLFDWLQGMW